MPPGHSAGLLPELAHHRGEAGDAAEVLQPGPGIEQLRFAVIIVKDGEPEGDPRPGGYCVHQPGENAIVGLGSGAGSETCEAEQGGRAEAERELAKHCNPS